MPKQCQDCQKTEKQERLTSYSSTPTSTVSLPPATSCGMAFFPILSSCSKPSPYRNVFPVSSALSESPCQAWNAQPEGTVQKPSISSPTDSHFFCFFALLFFWHLSPKASTQEAKESNRALRMQDKC